MRDPQAALSQRRFLILDEPTSVLTPGEADEVLGMLRDMVRRGDLTVLMITHKFREVMAFADEVTILRRGRLAGAGRVCDLTPDAMAGMMIGAQELTKSPRAHRRVRRTAARRRRLSALDDAGQPALHDVSLDHPGGRDRRHRGRLRQRPAPAGRGAGRPARGERRRDPHRTASATTPRARRCAATSSPACRRSRCKNACVARMSVADNLAFRDFDRAAARRRRLVAAARPVSRAGRARDRELSRSRPARPIRPSASSPAATCSAPCWRASSAARSTC